MSTSEHQTSVSRVVLGKHADFSAVPLWAKSLGPVAILNWLAFGAVNLVLGGNALGTLPDGRIFQLVEHGHLTQVSERTWLFSLVYSLLSLSLPIVAAWAMLPYLRRVTGRHKSFDAELEVAGLYVLVISVSAFGVLWFYLVTREGVSSLLAYLNP